MPDCSAKSLAESEMVRRDDDDDEAGLTAVTLLSAGKPTSWPGRDRTPSLGSATSVIQRVRGNLRLRRRRSRRALRNVEHVIVVDDVTSGVNGKPKVDVHRSQNDTKPRASFNTNYNRNDDNRIVA